MRILAPRPAPPGRDAAPRHSRPCRTAGVCRSRSQPLLIDRGDLYGGLVAHGELVESGRHGPVALQAVDPALHRVALLVPLGVEGGWPGRPSSRVCAGWRPDRPWTGWSRRFLVCIGSGGWLGTCTPCPPGPGPDGCGAGRSRDGYPDTVEHRDELRTVPALPAGQHDRQRLLPLLAGEVQLCGPPTPRPSESVIGRLDRDPTRRFDLQIPLFRAPAACSPSGLRPVAMIAWVAARR
jgi:hypothetical protein